MNAETFAEWMRRQGHQVIRTASSYWYDAGPHVLQAFPYHWLITPDEKEIRDLMVKHGIAALRYSTPLDFPNGMVSYHVVLNRPYKFEMLRSHTRNGVKRGLEHFKVERISFERLATDIGWKSQHVSSGLHTARHFLATVLLPEEVSRGRLLISIEERPRQSLLTLRVGSCIFHFRFWAVPRMRASLIGLGSLWSQLSTLGVGNG